MFRELSRGHFSSDNQKRLNGAAGDIPIFEAKMTSDLRLVASPITCFCASAFYSNLILQYQVDSMSDFDTEVRSFLSHSEYTPALIAKTGRMAGWVAFDNPCSIVKINTW
jgi:hypothetical protein